LIETSGRSPSAAAPAESTGNDAKQRQATATAFERFEVYCIIGNLKIRIRLKIVILH
jgi:hypothetical protein